MRPGHRRAALLVVDHDGARLDVGGEEAAQLRVTLAPGETRRVTLTAEPRVIADYDVAGASYRIAPGIWRVSVSRDAAQPVLTGTTELRERRLAP